MFANIQESKFSPKCVFIMDKRWLKTLSPCKIIKPKQMKSLLNHGLAMVLKY